MIRRLRELWDSHVARGRRIDQLRFENTELELILEDTEDDLDIAVIRLGFLQDRYDIAMEALAECHAIFENRGDTANRKMLDEVFTKLRSMAKEEI